MMTEKEAERRERLYERMWTATRVGMISLYCLYFFGILTVLGLALKWALGPTLGIELLVAVPFGAAAVSVVATTITALVVNALERRIDDKRY